MNPLHTSPVDPVNFARHELYLARLPNFCLADAIPEASHPARNLHLAGQAASVVRECNSRLLQGQTLPAKHPFLEKAQALKETSPQNAIEAFVLDREIRALDPDAAWMDFDPIRERCRHLIMAADAPLPRPWFFVARSDIKSFQLEWESGGTKTSVTGHCRPAHSGSSALADTNEDCLGLGLAKDGARLFAMGDGMGGGVDGESLSEVFVSIVLEFMARGMEFAAAVGLARDIWHERWKDVVTNGIAMDLSEAMLFFPHDITAVSSKDLLQESLSESLGHWLSPTFVLQILAIIAPCLAHKTAAERLQAVTEAVRLFLDEYFTENEQDRLHDPDAMADVLSWLAERDGIEEAEVSHTEVIRTIRDDVIAECFASKRLPGTTLAVLRQWADEQGTFLRFKTIGNSRVLLYRLFTDGAAELVLGSHPHTRVQQQFDRGEYHRKAREMQPDADAQAIEQLARKLMREDPKANLLSHLLPDKAEIWDSGPILLEQGACYVWLMFTDWMEMADEISDIPTILSANPEAVAAHAALVAAYSGVKKDDETLVVGWVTTAAMSN